MMSKNRQPYDAEIDLFETLCILWDGKHKIIATVFIVAFLGTTVFFALPNLYKISGPIKPAEASIFFPFISLNDLLENNKIDFKIDNAAIFSRFVAEFNDKEEILEILSKNEYVKQSINGLTEIEKKNALIRFAKLFKIEPPIKKRAEWTFLFEWQDKLEGIRLIEKVYQQVLLNTKLNLKKDIDELVVSLEQRKLFQMETLETELDVIQANEIIKAKQRKLFLQEQSAIAKEINIEGNYLNENNLERFENSGLSLSVNSGDVPFYLRGYKAIDKEIALIESRSPDAVLLSAEDYVKKMESIKKVEQDRSASQCRATSLVVQNLSPDNWISFDLRFVDIKSNKNPMLYAFFSLALGGVIGVIYTLTSNAIRMRKGKTNKA